MDNKPASPGLMEKMKDLFSRRTEIREQRSGSSGSDPYGRAFAKARPDADFRYFSNAKARASSVNATYVLMRHGLCLEVCVT